MNIVESKIQQTEVHEVGRGKNYSDNPAEEKEGDKKIEGDNAKEEEIKNSDRPELGK